ncbi:hypothetical protein CDAR_256951 [Caerostris darwini]|uniref:Uncharacterized protein n=1 Tax=Caerostris darwini TaxID=1538125 RepID=A0AAV4PWI5_9ARAC|nr:hypothetical protein CDAR_256951 [Caerostris darwini]
MTIPLERFCACYSFCDLIARSDYPWHQHKDASVSTAGVRLRIEQRNWSRTGNGGKNFCPLTKIFKKKKRKKVGPQVSRPRQETNNRMQHAPESPPIARLLVVNLLKNLVLPLTGGANRPQQLGASRFFPFFNPLL